MNPFSMEEKKKRSRPSLLSSKRFSEDERVESMYKGVEGEPKQITEARNMFRRLVKMRKENEKRMAPKTPRKKYGE